MQSVKQLYSLNGLYSQEKHSSVHIQSVNDMHLFNHQGK